MSNRILIVYDSKSGNTEKMAQFVAEGAREVTPKIEVIVKHVNETNWREIVDYQGLIVGCPAYTGQPTSAIKTLFDNFVRLGYALKGKVGGCFVSALGAGHESTMISILLMMIIDKMIVSGPAYHWGRYGAYATGAPEEKGEIEICQYLGRNIATIVNKLFHE